MTSTRHLGRLGETALERLGDRDALFFEGRWHRAAELHERSVRVGGELLAMGVRPGDRVVVVMANCPEVAITYGALWRAGAVVVPAIFLLPSPELRHIVVDSGAVGVVTTAELLATVQLAVAGLDAWLVCAGATGPGVTEFTELETAAPADVVDRADDDAGALLYTGGTTGRAKGVVLTHGALWECGRVGYLATHNPDLSRTIVPLPLAHAFGLMTSIAGSHALEPSSNVLMRWFDPAEFLRLVATHRMERATLVPTMLRLLVDQPLEEHDLTSWRLVICGSAPLPLDTVRQIEARLPSLEILEGYGLTESGGVACVNRPGQRRLGSVGTPITEYEARVEADGELSLRGPGLMSGYWHDPAATAAALPDGWLRTGDIGRIDDDGYVWVDDRKKDLILRGGFNVFPRDVEDVLAAHPAVASAGVVGRPDDTLGERVVAFVVLRAGESVTGEELSAYALEQLGRHKRVDEVRLVDAIPLTPIGKTDRKRLRELAADLTR